METNLVEPLSLNGEEAEVLSLREKSVNPDMTYEEITNTHTTNEEPINTNCSTLCQESNKLSSTQVSAESTPHCDQSNREAKEEEPIIDLTMKRSATVKRKHTPNSDDPDYTDQHPKRKYRRKLSKVEKKKYLKRLDAMHGVDYDSLSGREKRLLNLKYSGMQWRKHLWSEAIKAKKKAQKM